MITKYILKLNDEYYTCKTLKELCELTNLHLSSVYRLLRGITKFKNKNSKKLENIKIYRLTDEDYDLLLEDQNNINELYKKL